MKGPFESRPMEEVLRDGLEMLDIAAELDSATGGFAKTLPVTRILDRNGTREVSLELLKPTVDAVLRTR